MLGASASSTDRFHTGAQGFFRDWWPSSNEGWSGAEARRFEFRAQPRRGEDQAWFTKGVWEGKQRPGAVAIARGGQKSPGFRAGEAAGWRTSRVEGVDTPASWGHDVAAAAG